MGLLVLDVLIKPDHLPIAQVQILGIAELSLTYSISGSFPLVSSVSEKLGELQATLALEPLTETNDSSSSVPTVDMSIDTAVSAPRYISDQNMLLPSSSHFGSKISGNESDSGGKPIEKEHSYFQASRKSHAKIGASVNTKLQKADEPNACITSASVDVLTVLLERGSKLRNAMVVSALQADIDSDIGLKDTPLHLPTDNTGTHPLLPPVPSSGQLMEDILYSDIHHPTQDRELLKPDPHDTALEQILGSVNGSVLVPWDREGSLPGSFSGCSSVLMDSELSDPQYDQSLLESLFYKPSIMDGCLGVEEDEHEQEKSLKKNARPDLDITPQGGCKNSFLGLSMDRILLLRSISLARVIVIQLSVPTENTLNIPKKHSEKGKPPLSLTTKKCSYFVEYLFPLSSANNLSEKAIPVEVARVVSNKVEGGVVKFQHQSVFAVHFSSLTIKQWWDTNLTFTVYLRKAHQKKPVPVGTAVFPLRTLIQSDQLSVTVSLPVQQFNRDLFNQDIGPLKVSFKLAANKKEITSKRRLGKTATNAGTSRLKADISIGQQDDGDASDFLQVDNSAHQRENSPQAVNSFPNILMPEALSFLPQRPKIFPHQHAQQTDEEENEILFHTLLMVPDGKDFICAPLQPNVYLNCRLFGSEDMTRSMVSWGQTHPTFCLVQVAPVPLTSRLLKRMRNNVMVIEVWLRTISGHNDKLLGLVKLPLHQFYMSFRDPKICQLLLQAQYPVVAVDSYKPVVDIFTGETRGSLRVFLAMGTSQQITTLQRIRDKELSSVSQLSRPVHFLDHRPMEDIKVNSLSTQDMNEHLFVVRIEGVKGLTPLQSTIWGEADCFIQYSFPTQEEAWQDVDPHIVESHVHLKSYCTATTLCIPDLVFGHCKTHVLVAAPGIPVQRLLLSSLASQGFSNGGGIQFEVWCRYYYPNMREQLVARGLLPIAKLCAMVTMQRQMEAQLFCLPLVPCSDKHASTQTQPSGLLQVSVQYKTRLARRNSLKSGIVPSYVVNLVVQVHRATGLQAAAKAIGLQYYSEVGVNSFVTLQLSFLPEKECSRTRIAARSFCPEFEHQTEFCCPLLVQRDSRESVSLAEALQEAVAVFTVYNRDHCKVPHPSRSEDSILGSVKIRLADLLYKRTGISGWYGLSLPPSVPLPHSLTSVGGLELSINFSHCTDRERVLSSARVLGWKIERHSEQDEEDERKGDTSSEIMRTMTFSIIMPRAWVPVQCLLLPGHKEVQRSTYCYYRYKLYDQETFCSELRHSALKDGEKSEIMATISFTGTQAIDLRVDQPLLWYLREEKLEVQLWISFGKEKRMRPHKLDRLVGCAFVDLSALATTSKHKQTISGVYPLFKRSAADLGGAALRVHMTVTVGTISHIPLSPPSMEEEMQLSSSGEEEDREPLSIQSPTPVSQSRQCFVSNRQQTKSVLSSTVFTNDNTFTATVSVERAMHLSIKAEQSNSLHSCWVSYITAAEPAMVSTVAVQYSESPVWDHQQECKLSKELLLDPQQSLVFKVWHKGEIERVIGFASVDLSPLLSGFQSVCGWYNITDLSGQCQGQIKVSVSPLKGVHELRAQRQAVCENIAVQFSPLSSAVPVCYQTTAVYSSFPSHISNFSEQKSSTPEDSGRILFRRSSLVDHHDEHMDNVRQFHKFLQEKEIAILNNCTEYVQPSSSALFSALRKNLSELDDIRKYFSHKLSAPVFSVLEERSQNSVDKKVSNDSEKDTQQLLLKSNQLVGEVNGKNKNLREEQTKESSSDTHRNLLTPVESDMYVLCVENSKLIESENCETEELNKKSLEAKIEDVLPLSSLTSEDTDSKNEDVHEDEMDENKEEDEVEKRDIKGFEETLIEPRPLNEITSATDWTSPWTTVLSDLELGSLKSFEATEVSKDLMHQKHKEIATSPPVSISKPQRDATDSDYSGGSESCENARGDAEEDAEEVHNVCDEHLDKEVFFIENSARETRQILDQDQHDSTTDGESTEDDSTLSSSSRSCTKTITISEKKENKVKLPDASREIPNFFLPSHHLEASMRALRLAPVFPTNFSDPASEKSKFTDQRVTRPRPRVTPSSEQREETKRIAKIFASHFTQGN
ncbi:C2 domain-containing protein 3 isoform X2 [Clarias gariepinus]|nr:C2 domain-containing protein 3 isoform X2 [Clarias gariepinus]XP_053363286.1 C2 domain-containing protein 3 isoform X2 [Clarias gariepinus]